MHSPSRLPGITLPRFCKPWLLLPVLLVICLQTAWLGIRLAAGALPQTTSLAPATLPPLGEPGGHMTSADCLSCHQTQSALSHPVKAAPTMMLPDGFPLDNGQVNCTTCHRDTFAEHATATNRALLRGTLTGQAFCMQCHAEEALTRQGQHPTAIAQAHLAWPKGAALLSASPTSPGRDDGVNSCLSCHDGTVAPDAFGSLRSAASGNFLGQGKGHPVGVAYPASLRHGDAVFRPSATLDCRVRLTGGQVTCNSCHSLYSKESALLVMRNDNSALCLTCHAQ